MSPNRPRTTEDKSPPQNVDAERAILGAVLLDNKVLGTALKVISTGDFFFPSHRKIFRAMIALNQAGAPIDIVPLCEALHANGAGEWGEIAHLGGAAYISSLSDGMPHVSNVEHYARIVKKHSLLRQVATFAEKIRNDALEPGADIAHLQAQLREINLDTGEAKIVGGNGHLDYSLMEFLATDFPEPEHLIEGLIPRGGSAMIIAMPHHLKSWFTLSMALGSSVAGTDVLGKLEVKKPVRTYLITIEDFPGQVKWRFQQLLKAEMFKKCDPDNVRILPRPYGGIDIMNEGWYQTILKRVTEFKADHVIFDVMRRIFQGDLNSPKESSQLCEQFDRLRDSTGVTTTIVHHENRKEADIMHASAGSFNLPGWANVLIQFKRKSQEPNGTSHVEIEVDNKLAQSPEPVRMILDLASETPIRLESLEDTSGVQELRDQLGIDWTVKDLAEALSVHKSNALRRLKVLMAAGVCEKVSSGKRGRTGGLARYRFVGAEQ